MQQTDNMLCAQVFNHVSNTSAFSTVFANLNQDRCPPIAQRDCQTNQSAPTSPRAPEPIKTPEELSNFPMVKFPEGTKNVIINIGSNTDPIMPPENDPSTVVIAGELLGL
jgi:hypothetical protein